MGVVRATISVPMRFAQCSTGPKRPRPIDSLYKAGPEYYHSAVARRVGALPAVVRERLVGIGHAVSVLTLAHGGAAILGGLHQFRGKPMRH